jgi:hypothetical protein
VTYAARASPKAILVIVYGISAACAQSSDFQPESTGSVRQEVSNKRVGVHATKCYQNNWQVSLDYQWGMTDGFVSTIGQYDQAQFYYGLNGKQYDWHTTGDGAVNSLEDVDLFLTTTHGGVDDFFVLNHSSGLEGLDPLESHHERRTPDGLRHGQVEGHPGIQGCGGSGWQPVRVRRGLA